MSHQHLTWVFILLVVLRIESRALDMLASVLPLSYISCPCFFKTGSHWALMVYAYNPSYPRSRDQEDRGSKPALGK
jgi:hypothetical protein